MSVRIVCIGDNVVDCYISAGLMFPGGNCFNLAVYASRFGALSSYIGAIADDAAGALITKALTTERVEHALLRTEPGETAYCLVGHENGDRVFLRGELGVSMFEPSIRDLEALAQADAAHVSQSSGLDDQLAEISRRTRLSYDFSVRMDDAHITTVAPLCYLANISGGHRSGAEIDGLVAKVTALGAAWVLVTRGELGAVLSNGVNTYRCAAVPVTVVDTLGAGDTFAARVLVGLLRGDEPNDMLRAAASAAADTCTRLGAIGFGAPIDVSEDLAASAVVIPSTTVPISGNHTTTRRIS